MCYSVTLVVLANRIAILLRMLYAAAGFIPRM